MSVISNIDRSIPPAFKNIEKVDFIKAVTKTLSNGINVNVINAGSQEILRIDFIFGAGKRFENKPLLSTSVNGMILEGTKKRTAAEIADAVDYYGAFLEHDSENDWSTITLYTLEKYLQETIPVVLEVISDSIFPEKEFNTFIQNRKQRYLVNNQKVNIVARKKFAELLFGNSHPYGYNVQEKDFDMLRQEELVGFYKKHYHLSNCNIVISGMVTDKTILVLDQTLGKVKFEFSKIEIPVSQLKSAPEKKVEVVKEGAIQSALRVGRLLFNKTDKDYIPFQVLNTVFGGYFGSRLMSNIREDKGYTYGIGSGLASLQQGGYFFISTEVGVDVTKKALNEIYFEMKRLREETISSSELDTVRSYMLGTFLRSVDGPFSLADRFIGIMTYGLTYDYYKQYVETVKNITPQQLNVLANKYLLDGEMIELVVGKKA